MQDSYRNICRIGRKAAVMTQERWAEAVGCSVEAIRGYERGEYMPSDDLAMRMADAAGMPVLSHWHLFNKSALARELLPEVLPSGAPAGTLLRESLRMLDPAGDLREGVPFLAPEEA